AKEFINLLYNSDSTQIKSMQLTDLIGADVTDKLADELAGLPDNEALKDLFNQLKEGNITVKQFISNIFETAQNSQLGKDLLEKLIGSDIMKECIHQAVNETMKLLPLEIRENNAIPEYYNRIKKTMEEAEKSLNKLETGAGVLKEMNQVKASIDFMNDLNKNMTYFQMPVKFSDSEGNGELYVFTNKKALNKNSDSVSAMLHLDMENLGPIDIYVKLAGKNVSTNFCLESEEMLDFVYSHIDSLNERLEKLGYSVHFEMNITDISIDKFDIEKNFIENDVSKIISEQYIFDSRV
ncbi:MAG: flagellar hook-length control protein FliK, partial [Eubacteriales bacterium]|nr:flagellar hook-length control protein FliK [Eubacteriales bacterium]